MKKIFPIIEESILESICKVIADTDTGLTGSEIGKYLINAKMRDVSPDMTKWKRVFNSFAEYQTKYQCSNNILTFIQKSLHPSRFINKKDNFDFLRSELNKVLSFIGLQFAEDGKFNPVSKSKTITDAKQRETFLLTKLKERNIHNDILVFCNEELLIENYFHAVFEATKSVADKIRTLSKLQSDGAGLVEEAFAIRRPLLQINTLSNETEESEHKGFANLLKGFFGMFRNTTAHAPKIKWIINENDALDIMTIASLCHRKLDNVITNQ